MVNTGTIPPTGVTWSPEPNVRSDRRSPTNMPEQNLTPEILAAALQGLEAQRARLDAHIAAVRHLLGARTQEPAAAAKAARPRRRLSAAALKHIVEAQKKRWAEYHRKQAAAAAKTPRPKRKMSAAARKRISDATRKRWAEYRRKQAEAAAKAKGPAVVKKVAPKKVAAKKTVKKTAAKGPKTAAAEAATQPVAAEGVSE